MSKPLTEHQRRILDNCVPDDQNLSLALVAALDRLEFLERKLRCAEDYLVPALLRYANTEYNSRTDADATIQWRADKALQAYNDVTE